MTNETDLIKAAEEALEIAKGNKPAARLHHSGHTYVPKAELESAQARIAELEEGLTLIERIYYMEGKPAAWRAAHMNGTAREAQNGESYSCKRLFPRAALDGKGHPANQDSHGTDQQHESKGEKNVR